MDCGESLRGERERRSRGEVARSQERDGLHGGVLAWSLTGGARREDSKTFSKRGKRSEKTVLVRPKSERETPLLLTESTGKSGRNLGAEAEAFSF